MSDRGSTSGPDPGNRATGGLAKLCTLSAATGDTRVWIDNLERILAVAEDPMTPGQRLEFKQHPDIDALIEAAGHSPVPP